VPKDVIRASKDLAIRWEAAELHADADGIGRASGVPLPWAGAG
jgi:hypothetical protein